MSKTVVLRVADRYRKGCPSNGAGRQVGYGVTSKGALGTVEPWCNQAPWFVRRTRPVLVTDSVGEGEVVWAALGWLEEHVKFLTPSMSVTANKALDHMRKRQWASAILAAVEGGYLQ